MGVLNARRHRRGNHRTGHEHEDDRSDLAVLNARRHRRGNHQRRCDFGAVRARAQRPKASEGESPLDFVVLSASSAPCSTPEGIGGGITLCTDKVIHAYEVLNARRHRRGNHPKAYQLFYLAIKCSTPEGIGGGITPPGESVKTSTEEGEHFKHPSVRLR